jgi:phosphoribosyl 1,2-cyclic phosphodiesterase
MPLEVCVLASGSSGNCTYVSSGSSGILVDCGLSARDILKRLAEIGAGPKSLNGILISHAHSDHYRSAGTLFAKYDIPVFTARETLRAIDRKPACGSFWRVTECGEFPGRIGDISITTFPVPHGGKEAGKPVGFVFENGGRRLGHVTDCGEMPQKGLDLLKGVDSLVIEANYHDSVLRHKLRDPSFAAYWSYLRWVDSPTGHLSNQQCAGVLRQVLTEETKAVFPAHMSDNHYDARRDNNDFATASSVMMMAVAELGLHTRLCRTYRKEKTPGQRSEVVRLD